MVINRVSFLNVNFVGMTHRLRFDFGLWRPLDPGLIILINVSAQETDPVSWRNMFAELSVDMPTEACRYASMSRGTRAWEE